MARSETNIVHRIMQDLAPISTLIKNVRGMFYMMDKVRKIKAGLLADGAGDLIGPTPIRITPEMVGRVVGVFTAFEVKTETGRPSEEQLNFCRFVRNKGGIAGVVRNSEDAKKLIDDFKNNTGQGG